MDTHFIEEEHQMGNHRNGKTQKLVQIPLGEVTTLTEDIANHIISLIVNILKPNFN